MKVLCTVLTLFCADPTPVPQAEPAMMSAYARYRHTRHRRAYTQCPGGFYLKYPNRSRLRCAPIRDKANTHYAMRQAKPKLALPEVEEPPVVAIKKVKTIPIGTEPPCCWPAVDQPKGDMRVIMPGNPVTFEQRWKGITNER